jgi:hypothetical protein
LGIFSISRVLNSGYKGVKLLLFGFRIGTKGEKLNSYFSNILNSPLVLVLYPKSTTFSHLEPVLSSLEIEEQNTKKGTTYGYLFLKNKIAPIKNFTWGAHSKVTTSP